MSRGRTPRDLRERMERVAAKSRRPAESGTAHRAKRPAAPTDPDATVPMEARADVVSPSEKAARQTGAVARRRAGAGTVRQSERPAVDAPDTGPRSRAETLLAWGLWEVTEVPAQRWKWFKSAIRGGEAQAKQRKRGG